jgi:hypothetical protein
MSLMIAVGVGALVAGAAAAPAQAGGGHHGHGKSLKTIIDLSGPRGVDNVGKGKTLVTENDGTFSLVVERKHKPAKKYVLGSAGTVDPEFPFANAISADHTGKVYVLTGGGPPDTGSATLYKWRHGWAAPVVVADIAAYQATDPDPYNQADDPGESNPYGVAALKHGAALVSDAAGNDLLKVSAGGHIKTVARILPRLVKVPEGLPATDPEGNPTGLPPAGTPITSESVATSVTVGADGYYYLGELRGFPATPGTSSVWRIDPKAHNAKCDWEHPYKGKCKLYKSGFTSIVDLAADGKGNIYVLELDQASWLALELGAPTEGGLFKISPHRHVRELAKGKIASPAGGVDVSKRGTIYLTGPVFGEGALSKLR